MGEAKWSRKMDLWRKEVSRGMSFMGIRAHLEVGFQSKILFPEVMRRQRACL
jgi:hypothetical protein